MSLLRLMLVLLPVMACAADPVLVGKVIKITDGDTIKVQIASGPINVRFDGVDAPETNQPYGKEAKQFLADLVEGRQVQLEPIEQDQYDRLVAKVFIGGVNVNERIVAEGWGWAFRRYQRKETRYLCDIEVLARKARLGLWAAQPSTWIYPSDWRRLRRKTITATEDFSKETAQHCLAVIGKR